MVLRNVQKFICVRVLVSVWVSWVIVMTITLLNSDFNEIRLDFFLWRQSKKGGSHLHIFEPKPKLWIVGQ